MSNLELLAVIVFEISSFLCPNLQRAIAKKMNNNFYQVFFLIILYLAN